jgi:DNA-directed RNA polymerase subunit RPC12/RpoP
VSKPKQAPATTGAAARRAPRVKSARPRARSRRKASEAATSLFGPQPAATAAHARLGVKYECFECGAKFYDLNRPEPLCPKCGTDQRMRPKHDPKARPSPPEPRRPRPDSGMAPLLEDEEVVAAPVEQDALDLGLVEPSDASFLGEEEETEEESEES